MTSFIDECVLHIIRPAPGYLALLGEGVLTYALPDAKFWAWLGKSGYRAHLAKLNPARMARVLKQGVAPFTYDKLAGEGWTNAALCSPPDDDDTVMIQGPASPAKETKNA